MLLPVFLMPQGEAVTAPALHTRLVREGDGSLLEIRNTGNQHAQIAELGYVTADGQRHTIADGLSGYVLPGKTKRWPLPPTVTMSGSGTFKARINGEPVEQSLPLDPTTP